MSVWGQDRQCGSCSQCCRLLDIEEIQKPSGKWCQHCRPGKNACQIYETRPSDCADFLCLWRQHPELGPEWFPHRSKIVVVSEDGGNRIALHVDPSFPLRWREEPYFGTIKKWAVDAVERRRQVIVYIKDRAIVVLPNKEIDLGRFGPTDHVIVREKKAPFGRDWDALKVPIEQIPRDERDRWVTKVGTQSRHI